MPHIIALASGQGVITFGLATALGLRAARRLGLGAPHLTALLHGEPPSLTRYEVTLAAAAGAGTGAMLAGVDWLVFPGARKQFEESGVRAPNAWEGLLASSYGAIGEEVLLRLGVLSGLALGLRRLRGDAAVPPAGGTMWPAILGSSLLFGLGHLPAVRALTQLNTALVVRTLALNGIGGAVFGWLYWRHDLESAMIAHGAADVILHVGTPIATRIQYQGCSHGRDK